MRTVRKLIRVRNLAFGGEFSILYGSSFPRTAGENLVETVGRRFSWASLPLIATVSRLLHRELVTENEYLRVENRVVKSKVPGQIRFTDEERRSLVDAALAMGRRAMRAVVSIVKPETILRWQRRLEQRKWDYSKRHKRKPDGLPQKSRPRPLSPLFARSWSVPPRQNHDVNLA